MQRGGIYSLKLLKSKRKSKIKNRFVLNHFVKGMLLTICIGLSPILFISCHETIRLLEGETVFIDYEDVTIKLPEFNKKAYTYWIKSGDELFLEWDSIGFLIDREREMCTVENYSTKEKCKYCDACLNLRDCGVANISNAVPIKMGFAPEFIRTEEPAIFFDVSNAFLNACRTLPDLTASFAPEKSGLYFLYGKGMNFNGETGGEAKVRVLDANENPMETVKYKLKKEISSTGYWVWQMPATTVLEDLFSENVKIQKIRILNGNETIRPSRIFFHPNYDGSVTGNSDDINGCFSNPNSPQDDAIVLGDCKKSPSPNSNIPPETKDVTPVYDNMQTGNKLTWFAEFIGTQGGDDVSAISDLEIEFTIEAKNL